jgi:hypothetical protein
VLALGVWTAFVWLTRIRNALGDDGMTSRARTIALLTAVAFLAGAAALVWAHRVGRPWVRRATAAFGVVTILYWLIRMATILVRDHSAGFKVVHAVLAVVFVGLAGWAVRAAGGGAGRPGPGRTPA